MTDPIPARTPPTVRLAAADDLGPIKELADRERRTLGFVHRAALVRAIERSEVYVAAIGPDMAGFCHVYRRRDGVVTIYHIAVEPAARRCGLGRALLRAVAADALSRGAARLRLKCPVDAEANGFYRRLGLTTLGIESGKTRPLVVWEMGVSAGWESHLERDTGRPSTPRGEQGNARS